MEQLNITVNDLTQMCRLCLSRDMTMNDVFWFSSELGKEIADIIMECAPVQITRHDKLPTCICQLCFTQLKKFHQFRMQAVQSDRKLQHYLQQLSDDHPQIEVECVLEEHSNNFESQNYNADVTTTCDPLEISDNFSSKQKVLENFSAVNQTNEEINLKFEIKDEPMDDNYLNPSECNDAVETQSMCDGGEISCKNSVYDFCDTKIEYFECPIKLENDMTEKIPLKSEETYVPLKEGDSILCSENVEDEHPIKHQNLNEVSQDVRNVLLKKSTNSTGGKSHRCDICQKFFKFACDLKKHNLIHTGERPYQCDICEMGFRTTSHLKRHKLTHTGEKPYQCDFCEMRFREMGALRKHNLMHTGEKPYYCVICKMHFRDLKTLKNHISIHTGEKPYQCEICKMCFRQAVQLKSHNLVHTGEKPHQCDICKMCFRHTHHLKTHKLTHTGEKPHQCDICKKSFRHIHHLKSHKVKHTE